MQSFYVALNADLDVKSGTISNMNNNMTDHGTFLNRIGNIVFLNVRMTAKSSLSPGVSQDLFSLPENYRPTGYCRFPSASTGFFFGEIVIEGNGAVRFIPSAVLNNVADGTLCIFVGK